MEPVGQQSLRNVVPIKMPEVDDDISFNTNAFGVVGSWLLGGKAAATERAKDEEARVPTARRAPVTLYRPSSTTASLTRGGEAGANSKVLTEKEKEMKKKLLRKSGTYQRQQQQQDDEKEVVDTEAMDKEEEALLRAKHGAANQKTTESTAASMEQLAAESTGTPAQVAPSAEPTKKRKVSAQEELLEKLREDAARKKAKNLKTKQRLQRKKEEAKQKQMQMQAHPTAT